MINEEMANWIKTIEDRIECLEYCTYKKTRSGKSRIERLRKEFEEMKWVMGKQNENTEKE